MFQDKHCQHWKFLKIFTLEGFLETLMKKAKTQRKSCVRVDRSSARANQPNQPITSLPSNHLWSSALLLTAVMKCNQVHLLRCCVNAFKYASSQLLLHHTKTLLMHICHRILWLLMTYDFRVTFRPSVSWRISSLSSLYSVLHSVSSSSSVWAPSRPLSTLHFTTSPPPWKIMTLQSELITKDSYLYYGDDNKNIIHSECLTEGSWLNFSLLMFTGGTRAQIGYRITNHSEKH